ncbi:MAG TPA: hypothetical protein DIU00_11495, partial [Phycisphaerales bacterium]|nr:hypothetical protein [Phycisphaerales bacterium]
EDRLVESCYETDGVQPFDKVPLGCNKVVAEYIDFLILLFTIFIQLLYQEAQSFMSLFIFHGYPLFMTVHRNMQCFQDFQFGLMNVRL